VTLLFAMRKTHGSPDQSLDLPLRTATIPDVAHPLTSNCEKLFKLIVLEFC
jgi:hypothetical protein